MAGQLLLTLDDVPLANPVYHDSGEAQKILRTTVKHLLDHRLRVVLFVVGSRANSALIGTLRHAVARSGGDIELGNHTYSHEKYMGRNFDRFVRDIVRNQEFLVQHFGGPGARYFRPPFSRQGVGTDRVRLESALTDLGLTPMPTDFWLPDWEWDARYLDARLCGNRKRARRIRQGYSMKLRRLVERAAGAARPATLQLHANALNSCVLDAVVHRHRHAFS